MSLSLSHSRLSLSLLVTLASQSLSLSLSVTLCSPTHVSVGLNVIGPSQPKPQAIDPRLRPIPLPSPPSQRSPNTDQTIALVFCWSDPSASDSLLFRRLDPRRNCPPQAASHCCRPSLYYLHYDWVFFFF